MTIDEVRVARDLSLEELAAQSGVSLSTAFKIMNGIPVKRISAEKVCRVLDYPIENVVIARRRLGRRPKVRKE